MAGLPEADQINTLNESGSTAAAGLPDNNTTSSSNAVLGAAKTEEDTDWSDVFEDDNDDEDDDLARALALSLNSVPKVSGGRPAKVASKTLPQVPAQANNDVSLDTMKKLWQDWEMLGVSD